MVGNLKVIPVIDILNGRVVHAVKGNRSEYRPLKSSLTQSTDPLDVAKVFKSLGFCQLYVADLDAIIECASNFSALKQIARETGLELMVDAGVTSLDRAEALFEAGISKLIIGTETLQNKQFVRESIRRFGAERVILSLDLKEGKVLLCPGFVGSTEPQELLGEFRTMGLTQVIVLDLSRVGSGVGVNLELIKKAIGLGLDVYAGGGVRDIADLSKLKEAGIRGALVATALHTGKIDVSTLKQAGLI